MNKLTSFIPFKELGFIIYYYPKLFQLTNMRDLDLCFILYKNKEVFPGEHIADIHLIDEHTIEVQIFTGILEKDQAFIYIEMDCRDRS